MKPLLNFIQHTLMWCRLFSKNRIPVGAGVTSLMHAAAKGDLAHMVALLDDQQPVVDVNDSCVAQGLTAAMWAAINGHMECLAYVCRFEGSMVAQDKYVGGVYVAFRGFEPHGYGWVPGVHRNQLCSHVWALAMR